MVSRLSKTFRVPLFPLSLFIWRVRFPQVRESTDEVPLSSFNKKNNHELNHGYISWNKKTTPLGDLLVLLGFVRIILFIRIMNRLPCSRKECQEIGTFLFLCYIVKYLYMTINVTEKDLKIEREVMNEVREIYEPFKFLQFKQNTEDAVAVFDFYGYNQGVHTMSVDVKALYVEPDRYPTNILSVNKWHEFVTHQPLRSHYMVYYYPDHYKFIRIYNLDDCAYCAYKGSITIYHKREKQERHDKVIFLPIKTADFETNI